MSPVFGSTLTVDARVDPEIAQSGSPNNSESILLIVPQFSLDEELYSVTFSLTDRQTIIWGWNDYGVTPGTQSSVTLHFHLSGDWLDPLSATVVTPITVFQQSRLISTIHAYTDFDFAATGSLEPSAFVGADYVVLEIIGFADVFSSGFDQGVYGGMQGISDRSQLSVTYEYGEAGVPEPRFAALALAGLCIAWRGLNRGWFQGTIKRR